MQAQVDEQVNHTACALLTANYMCGDNITFFKFPVFIVLNIIVWLASL